tara:strand:+ start:387 stop:1001 length:615 start_codon:yes stop_codon:yes gene_type:complete
MSEESIKSTINNIFPTPIYTTKLDRELTRLELKFVEKIKKESYYNGQNTTSNSNYILNEKPFLNLKKELDLRVKDYFEKVISSTDLVIPFITQSWLNYTEKDQYHPKHSHSNSFVSGVFYINCHKELDKITFFNDSYKTIKPEVKTWNLYNSESWWFPVKTNDIIMFPSSLNHMVETKQGDNTRISLAFNVFVKGIEGSNKDLT